MVTVAVDDLDFPFDDLDVTVDDMIVVTVGLSESLRPVLLIGQPREQLNRKNHGGEEESHQPSQFSPGTVRLEVDHRRVLLGSPPDDSPALRGGVPDNRAALGWDCHDC